MRDNLPQLATLPNGLRIVTDRMDNIQTAAIGVWVDVGARHEEPDLGGIAHLWEHMAFKGTVRRSAFDIAAEIENVGGQFNAYTGRELTGYFVRVLEKDVALSLDMLADILLNSTIDEDELARERAVIIQEIGQANDTPDDIIYDHMQTIAYPDNQLGKPVLGSITSVNATTRSDILKFIECNYHAGALVVSAAGAVDHDAIVLQCQSLFGNLPKKPDTVIMPAQYHGGNYRETRALDQVHLIMAFDGVGLHDPDYYTAQIYAMLMGGGMSSRLFQEVREKRGLVYSIHCFSSSFSDCGLFGVYAGTGDEEVAEMMPVIADELKKSLTLLPEDEIQRAKAQVKAGFLMSLESCMARAELWAGQLLTFNYLMPVADILQKIDDVSAIRIQSLATRILSSAPSVIAIGPLDHLEPHEATIARLAL